MPLKWGWIDTAGIWVIQPLFDDAKDFSESLAPVAIGEKWGFIGVEGKMIIKPQFADAEAFSEGYAVVVSEETWNKGYINIYGQMAIPAEFESAWPFKNGIALAVMEKEDGSTVFDFIDRKGNFLDRADHIDKAQKWFSEGFAPTKISMDSDEWVYMDYYGNVMDAGRFYQAHAFSEGLAHVWTSAADGMLGYIDRAGKMVIQLPKGCDFHEPFSHGRAAVRTAHGWGYIDRKGSFVIQPRFQSVTNFSEGLAAVKIGDKWGYIDIAGNMTVQPRFEEALPFHEGMAQVGLDGQWGYIKSDGRIAIGARFAGTGKFVKGMARVAVE